MAYFMANDGIQKIFIPLTLIIHRLCAVDVAAKSESIDGRIVQKINGVFDVGRIGANGKQIVHYPVQLRRYGGVVYDDEGFCCDRVLMKSISPLVLYRVGDLFLLYGKVADDARGIT